MSQIRLFISAVLLLCAIGGHAQHSAADTTGIRFSDLTFEQALKKAGEENKIVFIDCYTQSRCAAIISIPVSYRLSETWK